MITLLTGPNSFAIAETIHLKKTEFSGEPETYDATELETRHLPDLFMGATLFSPRRLIIIKGAGANKSLWTELEPWVGQVSDETDLLLVESAPDKRTRTYKQLQKHATIQEHTELDEKGLTAWLQAHARRSGADLAPDVLRYFIGYVGKDQWRLRSELDKLLLSGQPVTTELIQDIAEPYPEAGAFELLDATFRGDTDRAHTLLSLLREREDPYQFFGLLSSQVVALFALTVAGARRPDEIAKDMGLHPFVVKKLSATARNLGKTRVERLVTELAHADERIKTSGVDPWRQLEITLAKIG